jgi:DNA topoisomerase-1
MVVKRGRRGPFIACTGYPECKNTKSMAEAGGADYERPKAEVIEEACPECGKPLAIRSGRKGRFVGCTGYPRCRYTRDLNEPGETADE